MRVQPHLPSRPFTMMVTSRPGAARRACSAANSPAPPEPRMRMSVARVFTPPIEPEKPGAVRLALCARVQDPQARHVGRAVGPFHFAQDLDALLLAAGIEKRLAVAQLRVLGALEAALLDPGVDERQALGGVALVDVGESEGHLRVAILGRLGLLLFLRARLLRGLESGVHQLAQPLMALGLVALAQ